MKRVNSEDYKQICKNKYILKHYGKPHNWCVVVNRQSKAKRKHKYIIEEVWIAYLKGLEISRNKKY